MIEKQEENITDWRLGDSSLPVEERLAQLAESDEISADQLRGAALPDMMSAAVDSEAVSRRIIKWLGNAAPDVVVVPGAGDGTELAGLFDELPEGCSILLVERDVGLALKLFHTMNFETLIETGRLVLALGENEEHIEGRFASMVDLPKSPEILVCDLTAISEDDSRFYGSVLLRARDKMRVSVLNLGTLIHLGAQWQANTIKNLPMLVRNPGIDRLEGLFKGRPALIVAAGPSLTDALPYLAKASKRYVVVCVGTALIPLRNAGIKPDLVMSVDASYKTAAQFKTNCDDLYLACSLIAYPPLLRRFKGLFSGRSSANTVGRWADSFGAVAGSFYGGGTVSAAAMAVAVGMGCDPIAAVGLDLCFSDDRRTHAAKTMYDSVRVPEDVKTLLEVRGNYRDVEMTTTAFRAYIDIIRDYVQSHSGTRFINVNNGGALIDGMQLVPHEDLLSIGDGTFDAFGQIEDAARGFEPQKRDILCAEIQSSIDQMMEVSGEAVRGAMLCNQLIAILRMPSADDDDLANKYLEALKEIDLKIMNARESSLLLDMTMRQVFFAMGAKPGEHEERLSQGVFANRRSRELYEQITKAASWTRDLLVDAMSELDDKDSEVVPGGREEHVASNMHVACGDPVSDELAVC